MSKSPRIDNFFKGLVTRFEPQSIPDGAASDSLNWCTKGDKIELRRGYKQLGTVQGNGTAYVWVAQKMDGSEILFRKRGRKLEYYDETTSDWIESGTDIFPVAAQDDEPSFANYNSLAGAQMFVTSQNSSVYKVMTANPASVTDLLQTTFRGKMRIKNGRTFLWGYKTSTGGQDPTAVYGSYIDKDEMSDYTAISNEVVGSGNGSNKHFTGTLAFKAAGAKRTCFGVTFTDGTETFIDDYNGNLTGSAGGSGTINYTTADFDVTFNAAPANTPSNIKATYYWDDCTDHNAGVAGSGAIMDFSKSSPRTAGQGFVIRQDDGGGKVQTIMSYMDVHYCMHERKTWALTLAGDDSAALNKPYRERVGIPNWKAAVESGEGIYYVDDTDENDPKVRILTLDTASVEVIPRSISDNLDLSDHRFDKAFMCEWGNYILMVCRLSTSSANNRLFAYDKALKSWDEHDFYCSSLAVYNGTLIAGDSLSQNVYVLFSGLDDDDTVIPNHWNGNLSDIGIDGVKKAKRMKFDGEIGPDQVIKVSIAADNGNPVEIGRIEGSGTYVDKGRSVSVGASTIGRFELGGGGTDGAIIAHHYECEFRLKMDKFEQRKVIFEALGIGYASVSMYQDKDIRFKGHKVPTKYQSS